MATFLKPGLNNEICRIQQDVDKQKRLWNNPTEDCACQKYILWAKPSLRRGSWSHSSTLFELSLLNEGKAEVHPHPRQLPWPEPYRTPFQSFEAEIWEAAHKDLEGAEEASSEVVEQPQQWVPLQPLYQYEEDEGCEKDDWLLSSLKKETMCQRCVPCWFLMVQIVSIISAKTGIMFDLFTG